MKASKNLSHHAHGAQRNGEKVAPLANTVDFVVRSEGSIWLFTPLSQTARDFLSEHIQDDAQYLGDSLVVSHRYVYDLLLGLREHGLRAVRG
jgi:hypothetical protein